MDHWDPDLINPFARTRPILLLFYAGVRLSGGQVEETIAGWARNVTFILSALRIDKIDLFGFSMGGSSLV